VRPGEAERLLLHPRLDLHQMEESPRVGSHGARNAWSSLMTRAITAAASSGCRGALVVTRATSQTDMSPDRLVPRPPLSSSDRRRPMSGP
jgi:hypothetical protein